MGVEREGRERREAEGEGRGERSWEAALAGRASLSSYLTHVSSLSSGTYRGDEDVLESVPSHTVVTSHM